MPKRTPAETLAALESQTADDEMERVLALKPEELRAELAASGADVAAEEAKGDALFQLAQQTAPRDAAPPQPAPGPGPLFTRRTVIGLAVMVVAVVTALVFDREEPRSAKAPDPSMIPSAYPEQAPEKAVAPDRDASLNIDAQSAAAPRP